MRKIPLLTVPWPGSDAPPFSYKNAISQILFAPPANGHLTGDLILARVEVAQVIKSLPDNAEFFVLEEEQYKILVQAEKNFPWAFANEEIANFIAIIRNAQKIDLNCVSGNSNKLPPE